jgi:hypothetical protein
MPIRSERSLAKLAEKQVVKLERQARDSLVFPTQVRIAGQKHPIELIDLSRAGFGARTKAIIPIGSRIEVELPLLGFIDANVRWALCGYFGAAFIIRLEHHFPFITAACRAAVIKTPAGIQPIFDT